MHSLARLLTIDRRLLLGELLAQLFHQRLIDIQPTIFGHLLPHAPLQHTRGLRVIALRDRTAVPPAGGWAAVAWHGASQEGKGGYRRCAQGHRGARFGYRRSLH